MKKLSCDLQWLAKFFTYPVEEAQFDALVIGMLMQGVHVSCWEIERKGFLLTSWRDTPVKPFTFAGYHVTGVSS